MDKEVKIVLKVDAKTGKVATVKNSFDDLERSVGKTNTRLDATPSKLLAIGGTAGAIYAVGKAFGFVMRSGLDNNISMDASISKLTAITSASRGYTTIIGEEVTALQRRNLIDQEVASTMEVLKKVNSETAMGMSELVDVYALAKPGMDKYKWSLEDQIEIIKLTTNSASNLSVSAEELSTGIDNLADGTWEATSGFGKMMKTLGVSQNEYKNTADKVAYLKERLRETGEAQDNWATATSNFSVQWDIMSGQITQPIFHSIKESLNIITGQMQDSGPKAMQVFSDAIVDMVNAGVSSLGFLLKAINQVIGSIQIAYAGYQKYAGLMMGGDISKVKQEIAKLQRIKKEGDYGLFSHQGKTVVNAEIKALQKKISTYKKWNDIRRAGDKSHEEALKRTKSINDLLTQTVEKITIKKSPVKTIKETSNATSVLAAKIRESTEETKKNTKSSHGHSKALKEQTDAVDGLYEKYLKLTGKDDELFNLDVEKSMGEFIDSGAYSATQLSEIYDAMWDKYQERSKKANSEITLNFSDQFKNLLDGLFSSDLTAAFKGFFDGVSTQLMAPFIKETSNLLNKSFSNLLGGGDLFGISGLGSALVGGALSLVGSMFSTSVSQAELDAAKGRVEFSDDSLSNLKDVFEKAQNPLLDSTYEMTKYLRSMDKNFIALGSSLTSSTGTATNLTGADYTAKASGNYFSSKSTSLVGIGLDFGAVSYENFTEGLVAGYKSELKKKSKLFGLIKKEKIVRTTIALTAEQSGSIEEAFSAGYELLFEAMGTLGLSQYEDAIKNLEEIDIGKVSLEGLSAEDAQKRVEQVYSEYFSQVLGSVDEIDHFVDKYAQAGEGQLETLGRIAVMHEQSSYLMEQIGKTLEDISIEDITRWFSNFGKVTKIISTYTAQEQMLDIVSGAGGQDAFNEAMATFTEEFFTEAEQFEMRSASLADSFKTLGVALPDTENAFKELILGFEVTDEASATLLGELLSLSDEFATVADLEKELADEKKHLAEEALEEQKSLAEQLQQWHTSLAEKQLLEIRDFNNALLNTFSSLRESTSNFIDTLSVESKDDEQSYRFYAMRYNDLKSEMSGYFDGDTLREGIDTEKLMATYASLESVAGSLGQSSQSVYGIEDDVYRNLIGDFSGYLSAVSTLEDVMKVIITGDEIGLAKEKQISDVDGIVSDLLVATNSGNLSLIDTESNIRELKELSEYLDQVTIVGDEAGLTKELMQEDINSVLLQMHTLGEEGNLSAEGLNSTMLALYDLTTALDQITIVGDEAGLSENTTLEALSIAIEDFNTQLLSNDDHLLSLIVGNGRPEGRPVNLNDIPLYIEDERPTGRPVYMPPKEYVGEQKYSTTLQTQKLEEQQKDTNTILMKMGAEIKRLRKHMEESA